MARRIADSGRLIMILASFSAERRLATRVRPF